MSKHEEGAALGRETAPYPGPYRLVENDDGITWIETDDDPAVFVAEFQSDFQCKPTPRQLATARLLTAAPDLLTACEAAFEALDLLAGDIANDGDPDGFYGQVAAARDAADQALTKAKGATP